MYDMLSQISQFLTQPFYGFVYDSDRFPIFVAFILGLVGALAPCQITANISAITFYGNRSLQTKDQWMDAIFFIAGKIIVYTILGICVWLIGHEFQQTITQFFTWSRKFIGPFIVFIGLFLIGWIRLTFLNRVTVKIPHIQRDGKLGSLLMGSIFSLGFCPTMFVLFFGALIPLVLKSKIGIVLPTVFAIGTAAPLLVFLLLIWVMGINGALIKKGRKLGTIVQKMSGIGLVLIGILDTITYWGF